MTTRVRENVQSAISRIKWLLLIAAMVFTLAWMAMLGVHLAELLSPQAASAQVEIDTFGAAGIGYADGCRNSAADGHHRTDARPDTGPGDTRTRATATRHR